MGVKTTDEIVLAKEVGTLSQELSWTHYKRRSDIDSGRAVAGRYGNRIIGEFLKQLKLTEGRSKGIPKIIKSMATNNSPHLIFDTDEVQDKAQDEV